MTLDLWLQEALGGYSAGVQRRLGGEYRTHLEDSVAAGGSGNPVQVLGDPQDVARFLKRLYLTRTEWEWWSGADKSLGFMPFGEGSLVLLAMFAPSHAPLPYAPLLMAFTLIMLLAVRRVLRDKPPGLRLLLSVSMSLLLGGLNQLLALGLAWTPTLFNLSLGVLELAVVLNLGFMFLLVYPRYRRRAHQTQQLQHVDSL